MSIILLLIPFVTLFTAVYLVPLGYSVVRSMTRLERSGLGFGEPTSVFAGFDNYVTVLTSQAFWTGMGRVFIYGAIQVPVMIFLAMGLALLLDAAAARWRSAFRLSYFLPYAVPGVVAALLWAYLYVPQLSPIVQLAQSLGIDVDLLSMPTLLGSMANIAVWSWTGYNVLIYTAALQAIPREIYDAARVDGASDWKVAIRIKVPMIRGAVVLTVLFSIIGTVQMFNEPVILRTVTTSIGSEFVPMMMAYNATFGASNIELGSAISVVVAVIAGIAAFVYYRVSNRSVT